MNAFGNDIEQPVFLPENASDLECSFHAFFDSHQVQRVNIPNYVESKNKHDSPDLKAMYRKNSIPTDCLSVSSRHSLMERRMKGIKM